MGTNLKRVVSLGYQPLANNLFKKNDKCELYPLKLIIVINVIIVNYLFQLIQKKCFLTTFTSSTSKVFREHFVKASKNISRI